MLMNGRVRSKMSVRSQSVNFFRAMWRKSFSKERDVLIQELRLSNKNKKPTILIENRCLFDGDRKRAHGRFGIVIF